MKSAIIAGMVFLWTAGLLPTALIAINRDSKKIPEPARCYFTAVSSSDANALTNCFQSDAEIIDVSRKIAGIKEILMWAEREVFGGRYEILDIVTQSDYSIKLLIRFVPPGYSGDGFKAHYRFDFKDGKIQRMNLQYA